MERRSFLKLSCGLGAGILLSSLGVSVLPIEAFAQELPKYDRCLLYTSDAADE